MAVADYELVLMLDPELPDERRDSIAADARGRIDSKGSLRADAAWGMRKLAYEIRQRTEADYRFFRFQGESPLLDELDHSLKITDGVLRFRIFKVDPDAPTMEPPSAVALAAAAPRGGPGQRRSGPPRGREEQAAAAPAPQSDAGSRGGETPEAPAEPAPEAERTAEGDAGAENDAPAAE